MTKKEFTITGSGVVTPPGSKITLPADTTQTIQIVSVDPENGYTEEGEPIPSENSTAKVTYPDGGTKNHQCADVADLLTKITNYLQNRYNIQSFEFEAMPDALTAGDIVIKEIVYGA